MKTDLYPGKGFVITRRSNQEGGGFKQGQVDARVDNFNHGH